MSYLSGIVLTSAPCTPRILTSSSTPLLPSSTRVHAVGALSLCYLWDFLEVVRQAGNPSLLQNVLHAASPCQTPWSIYVRFIQYAVFW